MLYPEVKPDDWNTVHPVVDRLLSNKLTANDVGRWLQDWSDLWALLQEYESGVYRAISENTADQDAEARFLHLVEEIQPRQKVAEQALRDKLLSVPGYAPPPEVAGLYRRLQAEADLFRPENIPLETEINKLGNEYDKVVGAMSIDWHGQVETMAEADVHLQDPDRSQREQAWHKIMDRWLQERTALDELFLKMLLLRRQLAHNSGRADYREYQWLARFRFDYTPADCFTFHDAIEHEVAPLARRIYERKAHKLGVDRLRPWDTDVDPDGAPLRPFGSVSELEEGVHRIFRRVDPELADHFAVMRRGWLDLASRPSKAPGGYCSSFEVSRRPYIFMNAAGTAADVRTLLHEGGHAFHFMESSRNPLIWNHHGPMEFNEVASMSMELLAAPYLERRQDGGAADQQVGFYASAEARRAYLEHLEDIVTFLPYMAVVDAFQHWIYTAAPAKVTARDLDARWSELWDRFMPGVDWGGLRAEMETGWHRKLHIYHEPFYYVEYGLAQLGALQVWRNALHNQGDAVAKYRHALALGYTRSLPELYSAAGARFAFDRPTVGELMALVAKTIEELQ